MMKLVISSIGAEVIAEASNGKEAVELHRKHQPHITLLDVNMPVMEGKEALKQIKAEIPKSVVIMLTSLTSMEVIEECIEAGATNYIRKNTPIKEMKEYIKETWVDYLKSVKDEKKEKNKP